MCVKECIAATTPETIGAVDAIVTTPENPPVTAAVGATAPKVPSASRLTEQQINKLWLDKIKVPRSYLDKYVDPVPHCNRLGVPVSWVKGKDYPRVPILLDFIEWTRKYNISHGANVMTTYPEDPEMKHISPRTVTSFVYNTLKVLPNGGIFGDLHTMDESVHLENEPFDLMIISQTLEHVYSPLVVLENMRKKIRMGGYLFTSVPTLNMQHSTPYHFFHYTPMGLAVVLVQAGFEIVEFGQWGNLDYSKKLLTNQRWPEYEHLEHPVVNDPDQPIGVWALAKRIV